VWYFNGEVVLSVTDLRGVGMPIGHTRTYRNRNMGGDYYGPNGVNWFVWPYITPKTEHQYVGSSSSSSSSNSSQSSSSSSSSSEVLDLSKLVVVLEDDVIWFDRNSLTSEDYTARFGMSPRYKLTHDSLAKTYTLTVTTNRDVIVYVLHDLEQTEFPQGIFKSRTDSYGNSTNVTGYTSGFWGIEEIQYTAAGMPGLSAIVNYDYLDEHPNLIGTATLSTPACGTYLRAAYGYSGSYLTQVAIQEPALGDWVDISKTLYRYWGSGYTGGLKYVVGPAAYASMLEDGINPPDATEQELAEYSNNYYEYNVDTGSFMYRAVTNEVARNLAGGPGCAGDSFIRVANPNYPENADYNTWLWKITRTRADGVLDIVFTNAVGQVMLHVVEQPESGTSSSSSSSSGGAGRRWYKFYRYDAQARQILMAESSAILGYDESANDLLVKEGGHYLYLRDHSGLIHITEYATTTTATSISPGSVAGVLKSTGIKEGQNGYVIRVNTYTYYLNGTSYLPAQTIAYPSDALPQTTTITTTLSYEYTSGDAPKQITRTLPVVDSSQNGDGQTVVTKQYFDDQGRMTWQMDERGFITQYVRKSLTGEVLQRIDDVDTATASGVPAGWSTPAGGGLNLVTDYEYDCIGRVTQELGPVHEV
jgi:hypothetical protein